MPRTATQTTPSRRNAASLVRAKERRGTPADLLVVGLGNPTPAYDRTRHNVGSEAVRALAERWGVQLRRERKLKAHHATALRGERAAGPARGEPGSQSGARLRVDLAIPETFMNNSGASVRPLFVRAGLEHPQALVVVHDELDLSPGTVKVKAGGGLAGHNGLSSIRQHLGTVDFTRIRIGIGKPPTPAAGASFVLNRPREAEEQLLNEAKQAAVDAVELIVAEGVEAAMTAFNRR